MSIQVEDFEYVGLKRAVGEDANIPEFKGMINGINYTFYIKGKGKVDMRKGTNDPIAFSGFTKATLIDQTGFVEVHEAISQKEDKPAPKKKLATKRRKKEKPS